jgi:uncharacterized protein YndB with AHSA1/START domain
MVSGVVGETLVVRRLIRAPAQVVFEAWTQPEHLIKWWGPRGVECPEAQVDLRVGGTYRIANRFPDGKVVWIQGAFEEIDPPRRLLYSWWMDDPGAPQRVEVRFEAREGATEVVITHARIPTARSRDEHEAGWQGCLDGLSEVLEGAPARSPR